MRLSLGLTLLALCGCGGDSGTGSMDGGDGDGAPLVCFAGLEAIELSPADSTVVLDGMAAPPVTFQATGTFAGGRSETLDPTRLGWHATRTDDTPPGTIDDGVLTPFAFAGGMVTVTATDGCVTGTTTVRFMIDATLGTPTDPGDWGGTPVAGAPAPTIVYPSDRTRFPRNIYRQLFQWRTGGFSEFRLLYTGLYSTVTVYTDGAHALCAAATPAAGCWEAGETPWSLIAGSNAGGTAEWTVDALDRSTTPPAVRRSEAITLGFSLRDVKGAIFYWSTTSAGVRRANIADAEPVDYITGKPGTIYPDGDQVKCVACHVVSRDGRYLAAPVQADSGGGLWLLEVTPDVPPAPLVKNIANTGGHGFATISPDDAYVAAAWGGAIWTVDRATGGYLADLPLGGLEGTHPDWSPDNTQLVFATGRGDAPGDASLAVIPWLPGNAWGTPSIVVPSDGATTNLFPMFSPTGQWIAYSRGQGGHGDVEAQLMMIPSAGGTPIELIQANRVVSNQVTDGQHQNSQPTWAPPGDLDWIAFNSMREYGVVLAPGTQQIWVAAVDTDTAIAGDDPSYPAFRLTFQGLEEDNHRAYWTLDIRDPDPDSPDAGPPADAAMCVPAGGMCDPTTDVCCDTGYHCDTLDDGLTYTCVAPAVP